MNTNAVELVRELVDQRTIRECKECPLLSIENGKPVCTFSHEHFEEDCQLLELK